MKLRLLTLLVLFGLAVAPISLFAQAAQSQQPSQVPCCPAPASSSNAGGGGGGFAADLGVYGGYVWPNGFGGGIGDFQGSQIFGIRGGGFITTGFEIGGNYYWNSHFQPKRSNEAAAFAGVLGFPQGAVRANVWEVEFTYNFG